MRAATVSYCSISSVKLVMDPMLHEHTWLVRTHAPSCPPDPAPPILAFLRHLVLLDYWISARPLRRINQQREGGREGGSNTYVHRSASLVLCLFFVTLVFTLTTLLTSLGVERSGDLILVLVSTGSCLKHAFPQRVVLGTFHSATTYLGHRTFVSQNTLLVL